MNKTLDEIHQDVPADHYDQGIKNNLFLRLYHNQRFKKVLDICPSVSGPALDIGCHGGTFTSRLIKKIEPENIYGIDISKDAIKLISKRIPKGKFKVANAAKLPYKNNFFEIVFCLEMLEHVDNPSVVLSEMRRVMKKGSPAILLVPPDSKLFRITWFLWTLYNPVWRHAHVSSFGNNNLETLLLSKKFRIQAVKKFNLGMLKLVICQK